eukprot:1360668-Rhodomonas_salina.1
MLALWHAPPCSLALLASNLQPRTSTSTTACPSCKLKAPPDSRAELRENELSTIERRCAVGDRHRIPLKMNPPVWNHDMHLVPSGLTASILLSLIVSNDRSRVCSAKPSSPSCTWSKLPASVRKSSWESSVVTC